MRYSGLVLALLLLGTPMAGAARRAVADDVPYWPSDQKQRLKDLDEALLNAQRERFNVIFFSKDPAEKERTEKRFKEIQKERRQLFEALGN